VNTAGAIIAYSYNSPVVFIETNIRTVYIHHFFANTDSVTDKEVLAYVAATLDAKKSREWYWALMDYGSYLKTIVQNPSRKSKHYARQSAFDGSVRQIRGQVIKALTNGPLELGAIREQISDERLDQVLKQLTLEGFISLKNSTYHLGK
jgi:A/G-specific adenine glycosylase